MKILFASSSSGSRGGGETFLVYLGEALSRRGHEVALWVSSHPRMDEIAARFETFGTVHRAEYLNTYDRPRRSLGALLDRCTPRRAAAEWAALSPDLLHINKQNLEDGLDLLHAARRAAIPSVCTIHITQTAAFLKAKGAWLRDGVSRFGLNQYGGPLVAVSEARMKDLRQFVGNGAQVSMIANGVPIPPPLPAEERLRHRAELGLQPDQLAVLALGRLTAQKRPFLFLEIASHIAARISEARFFWIGDGPLAAEWDTRAAELGLAARVQRLGWRQDAPALLQSGDLLLHTAEYEGMPLAVLEAMAAGLPCAISEGLMAEMPFLDATNSLRVSDDTWIESVANRDALAALASNAHAYAAKHLSTDAMAGAYEALYATRTLGPIAKQ